MTIQRTEVPITQTSFGRLDEIPTTESIAYANKKPVESISSRRRNDVSIAAQTHQEPSADIAMQQLLSNYLAQKALNHQNIQFVPCMCPVSFTYAQSNGPPQITSVSNERGSHENDVDNSNDSIKLNHVTAH